MERARAGFPLDSVEWLVSSGQESPPAVVYRRRMSRCTSAPYVDSEESRRDPSGHSSRWARGSSFGFWRKPKRLPDWMHSCSVSCGVVFLKIFMVNRRQDK